MKNKYIDADLLKVAIEKKYRTEIEPWLSSVSAKSAIYDYVLPLIASLQQEQPDFPTTDEEIEKFLATLPKVEVPNKYKTPDWLWKKQEQPECSSSLVDVDAVREDFMTEVYRVLDADPTNDRANAIINAFDSLPTVSQQPKVDLVAELKHHLATTPKEQLEKEWKELEPWGNMGPTVQEFLYGKQTEVDLKKTVEFECIGKKVKMTVQELINYYIDSECVDVADECGF